MRVHRVALSSSVQERPRKLSRSGAGFTDALAERDESNAHKPPDDRALHAAARAHAPREGGDRRHRRCGRRGPAPVAELPQEHAARAQAREDHAEQLPGADGRRPKRRRADDGAPRNVEASGVTARAGTPAVSTGKDAWGSDTCAGGLLA